MTSTRSSFSARSCADEEPLTYQVVEFLEFQGTVVGCCGEAEAVFYQGLLTRTVAAVHRPYLGQCHVALVYEGEKVVGEVVYQAEWPHSGLAAVEIAGIVLDSGTVSDLLDHLQVVLHAPFQALGFQMLAYFFKIVALLHHIVLDLPDRPFDALARGDEIVGGIDGYFGVIVESGSRDGIDGFERLNVVAEKDYAVCGLAVSGEVVEKLLAADPLSGYEPHRGAVEVLGVADAVETGDRRDHYHVLPAGEQGGGGAQSQLLQLVVDAQVLFDICVGHREIGLRLVVIVVRDEVLHGVLREETLELPVELRRKCLVVTQDQGGTLQPLDDVGHREGLAGARDTHQGGALASRGDRFADLRYRLRLVTGRRVWSVQPEFHYR